MDIVFPFALLVAGLAILIYGADVLVKGSSSISKKMGIPPIVIGLTIVAFGTSAPELVVNLYSALQGSTELALGNIIGSNIANIFLILGVTAMISNLKVQDSTTWKEIPFAGLASLVVFIMANDMLFDGTMSVISRNDGLILLSFFLIFMYYTFLLTKSASHEEPEKIETYSTHISALMIIGGLLGLFFGGQLLVKNAIILAEMAGLSQMVIGLTIVAIGTSLPELVTSIIAAKNGHTDIAIGNVVGSNIFNIFWILGVTGIISDIPISAGANIDIVFCVFATAILFLALQVGRKQEITKYEGSVFLVLYFGYMAYLLMRG